MDKKTSNICLKRILVSLFFGLLCGFIGGDAGHIILIILMVYFISEKYHLKSEKI